MGFKIEEVAKKKPSKSAVGKGGKTKPAKKAAAAKKPATAKKPAAAKKPVAAKDVAALSTNVEKADAKRVPPRIIKKVPVEEKPGAEGEGLFSSEKSVAFAMSIAEEMKRSARNEDQKRNENEIRLSIRPTSRSQGKNTNKFPAADLKEFRKLLLAAREDALNGVDAMKATGFNEADDHEADGGDGTNQTLRLQALGQMGNINRTIQRIEEALHRIEDGSYGVCTVCGQLIRKPRLLNQPFVLTCMECQSEMERNRG